MTLSKADEISVRVLVEYARGSRAGHTGFMRCRDGKCHYVKAKGKSLPTREQESLQKKYKKRKAQRAIEGKKRKKSTKPKKTKGKRPTVEGERGKATADPGKRKAGELTAEQSLIRAWVRGKKETAAKLKKKIIQRRMGR